MKTAVHPDIGAFFPIKWKLIIYSLVFMTLMVFIGLYLNLGLKMSTRFFQGILNECERLEVLEQKVYALKFYTENFLADESYAALEHALAADAELRDSVDDITGYLHVVDNGTQYYSYLDLTKCLEDFVTISEKTISARRSGALEIAYLDSYKMNQVSDLISKYLAALISHTAVWGNERFVRLSKQTSKIERLSYLLAGVIALLSITFCINFASRIIQPLHQMVQNAEKIGEGHFLVGDITSDSHDELQIIVGVFNRMSRNIHELFWEIQKKAKLETELKEERMRNLEIQNMLRESEIQVLQSQVNPHFLYNTLNAISQVAILEDASETGELIKAVARLLRYNLQSLDHPVTVRDEINHIQEYIFIMGVRYGERINCQISVSGPLNECLIPCMTLQPVLENAYIHGVAGLKERKGNISVDIRTEGGRLRIAIRDNGIGIPSPKLAEILGKSPKSRDFDRSNSTKSSGLGIENIRKRLELFYKRKDLLSITSEIGQGTQVVLDLPMVKENDVCTV